MITNVPQKYLKNIKLNEYWVKLYEAVEAAVEDFAVLFDFWKAGEATEEEVKEAYRQGTSSRLKKRNSKAHSMNPKMNFPQCCRSTAEQVELKARTGQKCSRACTACMARRQGWNVTELDWQEVMAPELKVQPCSSTDHLLMDF